MNHKSNKPVLRILGLILSTLMIISAAVPAYALNTAQLRYDIRNGAEGQLANAVDNTKFALQKRSADGYWSSKWSENMQSAYMMMVDAVKEFKTSVQIPKVNESEYKTVWNTMRKEHPELFYAKNFGKKSKDEGNGHTVYTATWTLDSNAKQEVNSLNSAVSGFLASAPKNGSDYDKELFVHDKLVTDTKYSKGHNTVYEALVNHTANCDGYATAMKILLNKLNIPCEIITGTATNEGAHAWNRVTLNGKNYLTDTCWDDPAGSQHALSHRYFNLTTSEMNRDHQADKSAEQNGCTDTDQNFYKKNQMYYDSVESAEKAITDFLESRKVLQLQLPSEVMAKQVKSDFMNGTLINARRGAESSTANGVVVVYLN